MSANIEQLDKVELIWLSNSGQQQDVLANIKTLIGSAGDKLPPVDWQVASCDDLASVSLQQDKLQVWVVYLDARDKTSDALIAAIKQSELPLVVLTQPDAHIATDLLEAAAIKDVVDLNKITETGLTRLLHNVIEKYKMLKLIEINRSLMSKVKNQNQKLQNLALIDPLTQIGNRLQFEQQIEQLLAHAKRHGHILAILFIDLNKFKRINDSYGHQVGDELLRQAANRLSRLIRKSDFVARMGGDEFAIILYQLKNIHGAGVVAKKIIDAFQEPMQVQGHRLDVSLSIGIATYPQCGNSVDEIIRNADIAMYQAKKDQTQFYQFASEVMQVDHMRRLGIEQALMTAVENKEFELVYQPIFKVPERKLHGVEALIRWNNPKLGVISPAEFIPIAEENKCILKIGEWVLFTACNQLVKWRKAGFSDYKVSINLSPVQLAQKDLLNIIHRVMNETGAPAHLLEFELTEMAIMSEEENSSQVLQKLHSMGTTHSLDDFGTGYSSLARLKYLPINALKIDQSFVKDIGKDDSTAAIIKSVIALAEKLNLQVIAEGVETAEQLEFLLQSGCQYVQGYFFCRPTPVEGLDSILSEHKEAST